ncbi:hypothetical protein [Aromatoleum toluclasticum]|uniref:hypothetical protein n=1 Tax=Aromatoleum toluclasticum TaxID=92003 RepID=UPI0012F7842C|nr:hypothetical protein [Aromatoleum toluclasticum]
MDTIIHFVFWGLVEHLFFRIGRFVLRGISFGRVKLQRPAPLHVFLVAIVGFLAIFLAVFGIVKLLILSQ